MKITETRMDKFHKKLTDEDILAYAKNIGELKKKINEAEYAKKNLKNLYREMSEITGILEKGEVSRYLTATFTYHYPEENLVTITPPEHITDFPAVVRPMTETEIERHCEHVLEFEDPEDEDSSTVDDDTTAIMLDQIDNEEYYDPGTFVTEEEDDKTDSENEDDIFLDNAGEEEFTKQGDYYIKGPQGFHSPMVWDVLRHDGHGRMPDHIGTFYSHSDAKRKVRELRKEAEERITSVLHGKANSGHLMNDTPPVKVVHELNEPEQLSKVKVWKALNGGYFVFNEQQNPVPLKVLNSLENVVFLEQEGVEGVILKRHSEIIPSGIYL